MTKFYVCTTYDSYDTKTGKFIPVKDCIEWDENLLGPWSGPKHATRKECYDNSICNNKMFGSLSAMPNTSLPPVENYCTDISISNAQIISQDDEKIVLSVQLPEEYNNNVYLEYSLYGADTELINSWAPLINYSVWEGCNPTTGSNEDSGGSGGSGGSGSGGDNPAGPILRLSLISVSFRTEVSGEIVQVISEGDTEIVNGTQVSAGNINLSFDETMIGIGGPYEMQFRISNIGGEPLTATTILAEPSGLNDCVVDFSAYTLSSPGYHTVDPGDYSSFSVSFSPPDSGSYCIDVRTDHNDFHPGPFSGPDMGFTLFRLQGYGSVYEVAPSGEGGVVANYPSGFEPPRRR